ncbi:MAG: histidine phosphatase family protein [bacterium]
MKTRVILMRHGMTEWVKQKRYCGTADIELNETGLTQAEKLYERLQHEKINQVFSSDLKRCVRFAEIACKGHSINISPALRELTFGIFEGKTFEELKEQMPELYTKWITTPFKTHIPQAEDMLAFAKRVLDEFKRIITSYTGKTIVICTHAGPIRVILSNASGENLEDMMHFKIQAASMHIIEYAEGEAEIIVQNDTSHLDGTGV